MTMYWDLASCVVSRTGWTGWTGRKWWSSSGKWLLALYARLSVSLASVTAEYNGRREEVGLCLLRGAPATVGLGLGSGRTYSLNCGLNSPAYGSKYGRFATLFYSCQVHAIGIVTRLTPFCLITTLNIFHGLIPPTHLKLPQCQNICRRRWHLN